MSPTGSPSDGGGTGWELGPSGEERANPARACASRREYFSIGTTDHVIRNGTSIHDGVVNRFY